MFISDIYKLTLYLIIYYYITFYITFRNKMKFILKQLPSFSYLLITDKKTLRVVCKFFPRDGSIENDLPTEYE